MAALAKAVDVPGRRIVVFNPLPWTRDGAVEVPWTGATTALTDVASRETVAAQSGQRHAAVRGQEPAAAGLPDVRPRPRGRPEETSRPTPTRCASRTSCSA